MVLALQHQGDHHHHDHHHITLFNKTGDKTEQVGITPGEPKAHAKDAPAPSYNSFRRYSWATGSKFHNLLRELWKYIQSFEDEHYQIYYRKNINEETLRDYSSAIQEIIPRLAKVQSILNHNSRSFPDMMRWQAPTAEHLDPVRAVKEGAQDCQEFAIFARDGAHKGFSNLSAGAIIQGALACQAAASKAAVALQRAKFGDPVCDPATVIAGNTEIASVGVVVACGSEQRRCIMRDFL